MKKRIVRTISVLPTLLTLGNAFCGFLAMAYVADAVGGFGRDPSIAPAVLIQRAAWLVFLAMVFDALDGRIARITRTDSSFGAELDSLCDVITFGATPAFLVKVIVQLDAPNLFATRPRIALWFSVLFVACAILRLARYNVENLSGRIGPRHYFRGLPTPAAAGVVASLVLLHYDLLRNETLAAVFGKSACTWASAWILNALPVVAVLLGLLMISRLPFTHLVNRLTRGRRPFLYVIMLVFLLVLAAFLTEVFLAVAFCGYVAGSLAALVVPGPWRRDIDRFATEEEEAEEEEGEGGTGGGAGEEEEARAPPA
ncbi:MAG: CDP-alcohol phosphatidyltransferase family protein [Planctomycetes bacterium]|nr:CDP-alcohol phosphatidyltransferase family protein [Planctomycetota bacterium]